MSSLAREVFSDENSRLPFIPAFYLTRSVEQEEHFLNTAIPAAEAARADEFCLATCDKQGPSCIRISAIMRRGVQGVRTEGVRPWKEPLRGSA